MNVLLIRVFSTNFEAQVLVCYIVLFVRHRRSHVPNNVAFLSGIKGIVKKILIFVPKCVTSPGMTNLFFL